MKVTIVSYQRTYNLGSYNSEKIGLEATIDEGEDVKNVADALRIMCDVMHKENNPHLYQEKDVVKEWMNNPIFYPSTTEPLPTTTISASVYSSYGEPSNPLTQEQKIHNLITQSTSLPELEQYKLLSNNKKYPSLKEAYTQRLKELTNE